MESDLCSRRCRRSIRNLRRSSGFFTVPLVDLPEEMVDDPLHAVYGHVWLEERQPEESSGVLLSDSSKKSGLGSELSGLVINTPPGHITSSSSSLFVSSSGLINEEPFYASNHLEVVNDCMTQIGIVPSGVGGKDLTCSECENETGNVIMLRSSCELVRDLCASSGFEGKIQPQTAVDPSSADLSSSMSHDTEEISDCNKYIPVPNEMIYLSNPGANSVDSTVLLEKASSEENKKFLEQETGKISQDILEIYRNFLEQSNSTNGVDENKLNVLSILENNSTTGNTCIVENFGKIKIGETCQEELDKTNPLVTEPSKRKRLSLKKNWVDLVIKGDPVTSPLKKKVEFIRSSNNKDVHEISVVPVVNRGNIEVTSQALDTSQLNENVDLARTQTMDGIDMTDFYLPDFPATSNENKNKKRNTKSKAKSLRRSSRLFNLHEMPLSEISDQTCDGGYRSGDGMRDNVLMSVSPDLVSYNHMENSNGNKENTGAIIFDAVMMATQIDSDNGNISLKNLTETDVSTLKNISIMEEVLQNFSNLCVNENFSRDSILNTGSKHRRKSKRWSSIKRQTTVNQADSHICVDEFGLTKIQPLDDDVDIHRHTPQSTSNSPEMVSDTATIIFDTETGTGGYECENQCLKDKQVSLDLASSATAVDVDMDQLPVQEMQPDVISGYTPSMRLRRSRKSWDVNQNPTLVVNKKSLRRSSREGNAEKPHSIEPNRVNDQLSLSNVTDIPENLELSSEIGYPQGDDEDTVLSPGLLKLYTNKNFVRPPPRSWETIKESPKSNQPLFTKQRRKCYVEFEKSVTLAKLQRRQKKALDVYIRSELRPVQLTDAECERKLLDLQFLLDGDV